MRIDLVITELFVGGAERCLTELATGLVQAGDEVRVFSLGKLPTGQQGELVDRLHQAGIEVATGDAGSALHGPRTYHRLKRWLSGKPADVCQTFMYHANVLGTFAARSAGVATCVGGLRVAEHRPVRGIIERAAVGRMQSLVCVSHAVKQFAIDRLGCEKKRVVTIANGVDVERFDSATPFDWNQIGWPADSIVTLFVGRLHPQKGMELLQRQIDSIAPAGTNRRLLLVGDGPLQGGLRRWADAIGDDRVGLLPWQADVAPLMKACRLLVLPSHYEGMPNVVLEAMAAGRPVVCSRVEGSEELLSHALATQGFAAGDDGAMKKLVEPFLDDELLCEEVGRGNRSRVQSDFSIPAMIEAYRTHYCDLLAVRRLEV